MTTACPLSRLWRVLIAFLALLILVPALAWLRVALDSSRSSIPHGTPASGSLEHGHPLPPWGRGFTTYSLLGSTLGRQYVDGRVRDALLAAFRDRFERDPSRTFVVGETGGRSGGRMRPHRTHQNGLSVDLFMPLVSGAVPTWPWTGFGYLVDFDQSGRRGDLRIDFDALATLLSTLDDAARRSGVRIERVIVAPEYVPLLLATTHGQRLGALAQRLTRHPAWVRHDEHVHVDFAPLP